MIRSDDIKAVMKKLAELMSARSGATVLFVRGDQGGSRPVGVFFSYKATTRNTVFPHQHGLEYEAIEGDAEHVREIESQDDDATISLTFAGGKHDDIWLAAEACVGAIDHDINEYAHTLGLHVQRVSSSVQDRTTVLDAEFENRCGFDIIIEGGRQTTTIRDAVASATLEEVP